MSENIFNGNGTDSSSGGGGSYDDTALKNRISSLETSQVRQDKLIAKNSGNIDRIADFVGLDLTIEYLPLAQNQGVVMPDGVGLDTGLTLNGNAIFRFTGCLKNKDNQVCVIGARTGTSTSERTCINVLPVSGQIQSQWAANKYKTDNIEMTQPFEIVADKTQTTISQAGGVYIVIENAGFDGTNAQTPICLFNQALQNAQYFSPVLQRAEIEIDGVITVFEPKIKRNLETGTESVVLLKGGVEMAIDGLTLFEIQAV